jgi:hypothetical protein
MAHSFLGHIIDGSLQRGLTMRLAEQRGVEEIRAGRFVVINGRERQFFAMITDVALQSSESAALEVGPDSSRQGELMRKMLAGSVTYATVTIRPQRV